MSYYISYGNYPYMYGLYLYYFFIMSMLSKEEELQEGAGERKKRKTRGYGCTISSLHRG
jgi:hypothetical protein